MHVFTMTATGSLAILSLVQFSPVPTSVIGAIVGGLDGGAISGGIVAGTKNHHHALPPGVSKESLDQCTQQINFQGGLVNVYSTGDDSAHANNVPPACMNLVSVLLNNPAQAGGPVPVPMGTASLKYHGLSTKDKQDLQDALSG